MKEQEFQQLLSLSHETSGVEFKAPGPRTDRNWFAKVVRAVLALSNRRNGGTVIIGVKDDGQTLKAMGVSKADLDTWRHEDISGAINAYADPFVTLHTSHLSFENKTYVVIEVEEFSEVRSCAKRTTQVFFGMAHVTYEDGVELRVQKSRIQRKCGNFWIWRQKRSSADTGDFKGQNNPFQMMTTSLTTSLEISNG